MRCSVECDTEFAGVQVSDPYTTRFYTPNTAPNVTGYVTPVYREEVETYKRMGYGPNGIVGRSGIEAWGQQYLGGRDAATLSIYAADGTKLSDLAQVNATPASSITLTIDSDFQQQVQAAMEKHHVPGVVVGVWHDGKETIRGLGITWTPGRMAFHPGRDGEYAVLRWTAPEAGAAELVCEFATIAEHATTDVHVFHNGKPLFDGEINVGRGGPKAAYRGKVQLARGDTLNCVCGYGNGDYGADTTGLAVTIRHGGKTYDAAKEYSDLRNPNGPWSYGMLPGGPKPKAEAFTPFRSGGRVEAIGSVSNPGSVVWEDLLSDQHPYQRVPHTAEVIRTLRTLDGKGQPVFLSEYEGFGLPALEGAARGVPLVVAQIFCRRTGTQGHKLRAQRTPTAYRVMDPSIHRKAVRMYPGSASQLPPRRPRIGTSAVLA